MKELEVKQNDKIEIVKQQQKKQTLILQKKIIPQANHLIFEYNYVTKCLKIADYEPHRTDVHWHEAVEIHSKKAKKIDIYNPDTITKTKVIQKPNCVYVSSLNLENAPKAFKREYGFDI